MIQALRLPVFELQGDILDGGFALVDSNEFFSLVDPLGETVMTNNITNARFPGVEYLGLMRPVFVGDRAFSLR